MARTFMSSALLIIVVAASVGAQQPAQGRNTGPGPGRIGGAGIGAYPARPPADAASLERGKAVYGTYCTFCHGADIRGGDGGPSLLRSGVVLDDQNGELLGPVILEGRQERGMPRFALTPTQIIDLANFLHSFRVNGYDESRNRPTSIVVGNATAGEEYFRARCASCHSVSGDLRGLAARIENPRTLQQWWLMPGTGAGRGGPTPADAKPPRATVTLQNGDKLEGEIERLDDFVVALRLDNGTRQTWRIVNGSPRVAVTDPLQAHRELLKQYKDSDIHNVTAYLVTLK